MTIFVEDSMAQNILKALDEHGEALKKMGGCLTRLEESKLKKSTLKVQIVCKTPINV